MSRIEQTRHEAEHFAPSVAPPRGVLLAPEARDESFFHQRLAAPTELAPFIQHFWYVQWDRRGLAPGNAETIPHPSCYLVFEHDLQVPADHACVHRRAELSGVHTRKFARTMEGAGRVFGLKFQPGGLFPFLQGPVSMLTDQVVPAGHVFDRNVYELASELRASGTPAAMAAAASAYLASHLPERDPTSEMAAALVKTVLEDSTILTVQRLCQISGLRTRALQRLFRMYVGVSPKWVIRRYRIHELLERLNSGAAFDGARSALELGYADQSHLINDFTRLVGLSPGRYLERVQHGILKVLS